MNEPHLTSLFTDLAEAQQEHSSMAIFYKKALDKHLDSIHQKALTLKAIIEKDFLTINVPVTTSDFPLSTENPNQEYIQCHHTIFGPSNYLHVHRRFLVFPSSDSVLLPVSFSAIMPSQKRIVYSIGEGYYSLSLAYPDFIDLLKSLDYL